MNLLVSCKPHWFNTFLVLFMALSFLTWPSQMSARFSSSTHLQHLTLHNYVEYKGSSYNCRNIIYKPVSLSLSLYSSLCVDSSPFFLEGAGTDRYLCSVVSIWIVPLQEWTATLARLTALLAHLSKLHFDLHPWCWCLPSWLSTESSSCSCGWANCWRAGFTHFYGGSIAPIGGRIPGLIAALH